MWLFFCIPLSSGAGSEPLQETAAASLGDSLLLRRLQTQNQGGYNKVPVTSGNSPYNAVSNNGASPGYGGAYGGAYGGSSNYNSGGYNQGGGYIYPGAGGVANPAMSGTYNRPGGNINYGPPSVTKEPPLEVHTTRKIRGMSAASSSDPATSLGSSSGSFTGSFHTKSSEWSSSNSHSGSGWLWPWAYTNLPWVEPYWAWWQYLMTIATGSLMCCCFTCCVVIPCAMLIRKKVPDKPKKKSKKHRRTRSHEDEDEESASSFSSSSSSCSDVEEDPPRQASVQASSVHSLTRPTPHYSTHSVQPHGYHPQAMRHPLVSGGY